MALDKITLKEALKSIFEDLDSGATAEGKAEEIANAIDAFVRSGTVTTNVTVASVTGVTTGAGVSGPGTGSGVGSIT